MSNNLKPIDIIKDAGLSDFEELEFITGEWKQTLINWFNNPKKRKAFECIVLGASVIKRQKTRNPIGYWIWGCNRLDRKYPENLERLMKKKYEFALHCIEEFPDSIGREDCVQPGSPRSIVEHYENQKQ
ncbi:hypothetical protein [Vibrio fluvialis]|uniref:hypothetical protein n=1 Tax=Vibrio fluvialis TaxID=676 RepID=UPI00399BD967